MGKLILVRHGATDFNNKNIYFGKTDIKLNTRGIQEILKTKEILKTVDYDVIFSSPLSRAKETALYINYKNLELKFDKSLEEIDFGIFEGLSFEEIEKQYPQELSKLEKNWESYDYKTGETPINFQKRVVEFVKSLDKDKNILLVTHWGVINCILSYYFSGGGLSGYWSYSVNNGGICIIEFIENTPVLKGLNVGL